MDPFDPDQFLAQAQNPAPQQDTPAPGGFDPDQFLQESNQEQYGTTGQQALTGLEGAARGLTGGLSDALAKGMRSGAQSLGVPEEYLDYVAPKTEEIAARQETNPVISRGSEAGALVGGMMGTGFGVPGLIKGVAEGIAPAAAAVTTGAKIASGILRGGIESGLIQGGDEISKAMLGQGSPEDPVATALHVGAASILGAGIGGLFGAGSAGIAKLGETKAAQSIGQFLEGVGQRWNPESAESLEEAVPKAMQSLKPEAPDIMAAADRLNLPVMNGMVSGNQVVQHAEDALINGPPTVSSIKRQTLYGDAYNGLVKAVSDIAPESEVTKAQTGQALQDGITSKISEQYEPIKQLYAQIKEITPNIQLSKSSAPAIARNILEMPEVSQTPNSPQARLARSVAENILNAKTVDDIAFQKTAIKGMANSTIPGERRIAAILADKMDNWQQSSILRAAKNLQSGLESDPEKAANFANQISTLKNLVPQIENASAQYKPFIQDVSRISEELGKGKVDGPQDAMDFINNLDAEKLTNRLSKKDNSEFRAWFADKFPEQMDALRTYQKNVLRQSSSKSGTFSPKVFLDKVNSLEPEIQQSIFKPEELQKIKDANTYLRSFPKNFNPSGTAHMSAFREFFSSPTGAVIGNARDLALEKFVVGKDLHPDLIKAIGRPLNNASGAAAMKVISSGDTEGLYKAMDYATAAHKGAQMVNNGVEALFKGLGNTAVHTYTSDTNREKLRKYVEDGAQNQQIQQQLNQTMPQPTPTPTPKPYAEGGIVKNDPKPPPKPLPNQKNPMFDGTDVIAKHFPEQGIMLGSAKARINSYLNSVRPQSDPQKLPFDDQVKDKQKDRSYNKVLDLANQPLGILNNIKDGTLTANQMTHFVGMYPEMHNYLSKKMTERMAKAQMDNEKPSYKVRQAMSLFLGAPVDSTITPQSIMAVQNVFARQKASQQAASPPAKNKKGTSTLSKVSGNYMTGDQSRLERQQKV